MSTASPPPASPASSGRRSFRVLRVVLPRGETAKARRITVRGGQQPAIAEGSAQGE